METQGCGVCMTHVGTYAHTYTYTYMAAPVFSINRAVLDDTDAAASIAEKATPLLPNLTLVKLK